MQEALFATTYFPDAMVFILPVLDDEFNEGGDRSPEFVGDATAGLVVQVDGIDELTVDIHLLLVVGAIANADGLAAAVAFQVVEFLFGQFRFPVYGVHQLEAVDTLFADPVHEVLGLLPVAQTEEGIHGESRVADPGVAVVPVAATTHLLR